MTRGSSDSTSSSLISTLIVNEDVTGELADSSTSLTLQLLEVLESAQMHYSRQVEGDET